MKKSEFLQELNNNLVGKIKDDDLQSILMDYDEVFESSKAENKSEDETSAGIGSPSIVAKNILDDYTTVKPAQTSIESTHQIAPVGKRIVAFIIDSILSLLPFAIFVAGPLAIINAMLFAPISPSMPLFIPVGIQPTTTQVIINLSLLCIFWLYGTVSMLLLKNKTIGMWIMRIKVVKTNNTKIKTLDIIMRQFLGLIIIAGLTVGTSSLVSFLWMLFSKTNNTVHDKMAGTIVVEDGKGKMVK